MFSGFRHTIGNGLVHAAESINPSLDERILHGTRERNLEGTVGAVQILPEPL